MLDAFLNLLVGLFFTSTENRIMQGKVSSLDMTDIIMIS